MMDSLIIIIIIFLNFLMESEWRASLGRFPFAWRHVSKELLSTVAMAAQYI